MKIFLFQFLFTSIAFSQGIESIDLNIKEIEYKKMLAKPLLKKLHKARVKNQAYLLQMKGNSSLRECLNKKNAYDLKKCPSPILSIRPAKKAKKSFVNFRSWATSLHPISPPLNQFRGFGEYLVLQALGEISFSNIPRHRLVNLYKNKSCMGTFLQMEYIEKINYEDKTYVLAHWPTEADESELEEDIKIGGIPLEVIEKFKQLNRIKNKSLKKQFAILREQLDYKKFSQTILQELFFGNFDSLLVKKNERRNFLFIYHEASKKFNLLIDDFDGYWDVRDYLSEVDAYISNNYLFMTLIKDPLFQKELRLHWKSLSDYVKSNKSKMDLSQSKLKIDNYIKSCGGSLEKTDYYFKNITGRFYDKKRMQVVELFMKKLSSKKLTQ